MKKRLAESAATILLILAGICVWAVMLGWLAVTLLWSAL